ncbi:Uncharacterised protein [Streptococcus suis]|uniref:Uncharacterized protein n=1 Tax=Streptococcus suis TaxID=1307 RepID=A0A0Z8UBK2_STRSU|nr:Uncharacterised protein [Streptococcus suis]CYX34579.1 Uncharacterised protein [Streptococcus suis]
MKKVLVVAGGVVLLLLTFLNPLFGVVFGDLVVWEFLKK